jgi:hypothetical protein
MLSAILLNVIHAECQNLVYYDVVMLSVIMLNVMAPSRSISLTLWLPFYPILDCFECFIVILLKLPK